MKKRPRPNEPKAKSEATPFNENTSGWFIQGLDEERMAALAANDTDIDDERPRSAWAALLHRMHEMLRGTPSAPKKS